MAKLVFSVSLILLTVWLILLTPEFSIMRQSVARCVKTALLLDLMVLDYAN